LIIKIFTLECLFPREGNLGELRRVAGREGAPMDEWGVPGGHIRRTVVLMNAWGVKIRPRYLHELSARKSTEDHETYSEARVIGFAE
jgi:hypothetical protein